MRILFVSIFAFLLGFCGPVLAAESVPLPPNVDIVKPGSDVSPEHAMFSGKWSGSWDNNCQVVIVVESIDNLGRARIIFAQEAWPWTGKGPSPNHPLSERLEARFVSNTMSFRRDAGKLLYEAYLNTADGTLRVNRTNIGNKYNKLNAAKLTKSE